MENMSVEGIVLLCVVATVFIVWLIDRFTGGKITAKIIQWHPTLAALSALVSAVAAVLPSSYFATLSVVLKAVSDGTVTAEKLWKMGELQKEDRNAYAKNLISDALAAAGIEVTDQILQVIDGVIAIVCMLMPHEEDKTEAEAETAVSAGESERIAQELGI